MQKPSDTCSLARERVACVVHERLPALVSTFEEIYDETGDAEAHGIATLLTKYNTVACIYMLSNVLHAVTKLQGNLQAKEIDLASVPRIIDSTTKRLKEVKERVGSGTWFKDHSLVFSDNSQLGAMKIVVTEEEKAGFLQKVHCPYKASLTISMTEWSRLISCHRCLFLIHVISPVLKKDCTIIVKKKIRILIDFCGIAQRAYFDGDEAFSQPNIDLEETETEWKLFRQFIFRKYTDSSLQTLLSCLTGSDDISAVFPTLAKLAAIFDVLPVKTASV